MKFCDKLQKIRKEHNITQEVLADKLNVSRQAVSKWESGQAYPDTEKLIQISKIFDVSLDELIGENKSVSKDNSNKKFNIMETVDMIFSFIQKSISMFFAMTFREKVKFLFEMMILVLGIYIFAVISSNIIIELIRRIFIFLPYKVINAINYLVDTLLLIVWIILGGMFFVRVYKTRYLDYYIIINDDNVKTTTVEEPIKELKEKKEYKVVIRDPKDSSFNLLSKLGRIFIFCLKCFGLFISIPIVMSFIFFVILFTFSLYYIFYGLFFNGINMTLLGIILFIFIFIMFIYNLIFNRKNEYGKIFIIFFISISLIGMGIGLSFMAISNFDTYNEEVLMDKVNTINIEMEDNLVINEINDIASDKIIIDDDIDDIKMDILTYNDNYVYTYIYNKIDYDSELNYKLLDIYVDYNEFDIYKKIIKDLKNKKINTYYYDNMNNYVIDKIYISSDNLTKIKENYNNIYND